MNIRNRSLEKSGSLIHLAPKVFETLALLVQASPNAVSREELRATLWRKLRWKKASWGNMFTCCEKH
jgi:DNA-binding winged helix-turn-helix (wHTH) protein